MEVVGYVMLGGLSALLMFLTGAWFVAHHREVVEGDLYAREALREDTYRHVDYALSFYQMRWRTRRALKRRRLELLAEEEMAYAAARLEGR